MNLYENIFIGRQDLSQQQMEALGVSLGLFVAQNGGEVVRSEYCGFRSLAYPIKKNRKGHYYIIQMKANSSVVAELGRIMRINEDIIRQLIVRVEEFDGKDNLISQAKTFGGDFVEAKDAGYRNASNKTIVTENNNEAEAASGVQEAI
ncbi:MAG: 30S ribosomal protein S6 [Holosporaceae bacterium]|jgi:small subunit ribosomal protein S6|nr:30S ribosomal protein S6 [Holosporaceae bacterium]